MQQLNFKEIGSRIRCQREFLGYTREQLAEKLEVTPKFCSDIELGAKGMSLQTLSNLSRVLKLSTDYILFGISKDNAVFTVELTNMLNSCPVEKLPFLEDILKTFLLALD